MSGKRPRAITCIELVVLGTPLINNWMKSLMIDALVFIRSWYMALARILSAKVT